MCFQDAVLPPPWKHAMVCGFPLLLQVKRLMEQLYWHVLVGASIRHNKLVPAVPVQMLLLRQFLASVEYRRSVSRA